MNNANFMKGLFFIAIALIFGFGALRYPLGSFASAGPGLFPFMASCLLFVLGTSITVRSYFIERVPIEFKLKNIAIILGSLFGFVALSQYVSMLLGIIFLVFLSTLAGTSYSIPRNIKISVGLIAIAVAFKTLLGLQLPLY